MATCFDQLHGHPQATRAHKTKTKIPNFLLGQNETSVCFTLHIVKLTRWKMYL